MPRLMPCPGCGHHIRAADATSCPFCAPDPSHPRSARRGIVARTAARAAVGAAALLTAQVAVAQLTPPPAAAYGAPPGFDDPLQVDLAPTQTTAQDDDERSEGSGDAPPDAEAPASDESGRDDPTSEANPSEDGDRPCGCGH